MSSTVPSSQTHSARIVEQLVRLRPGFGQVQECERWLGGLHAGLGDRGHARDWRGTKVVRQSLPEVVQSKRPFQTNPQNRNPRPQKHLRPEIKWVAP
ncbi:MAG: hypothetical protein KatS3mg111_1714 [Pirellulaceae bacterium]|nr:MAG: hypothetical protein KatS3mg111_1714 [Pirellulaceae bacterium]